MIISFIFRTKIDIPILIGPAITDILFVNMSISMLLTYAKVTGKICLHVATHIE